MRSGTAAAACFWVVVVVSGQRRKSVRNAVSPAGMGSDIPVRVPLDVLLVKCATLAAGGRFLLCFRRQYSVRAAETAPKMAPGKKPARTAPVGKDGQVVFWVPVRTAGSLVFVFVAASALEEDRDWDFLEVLDSGGVVGMTTRESDSKASSVVVGVVDVANVVGDSDFVVESEDDVVEAAVEEVLLFNAQSPP